MLTTTELISAISQDFAPNCAPDTLVRYLDRCQRMIYLDDTFQLTYFNENDPEFPLPILPTVAGQLTYTISDGVITDSLGDPLNFEWDGFTAVPSKVISVLTRETNIRPIHGNRGYGYRAAAYDDARVIIRGELFWKEIVRLKERTPNSDPVITFREDPGDTTDRYYLDVGLAPRKILSSRTPMSLNVDKWEQALIDGVVGQYENSVNGRSDKYQTFLTFWIPKIRKYYNDQMGDWYDTTVMHRRFQ